MSLFNYKNIPFKEVDDTNPEYWNPSLYNMWAWNGDNIADGKVVKIVHHNTKVGKWLDSDGHFYDHCFEVRTDFIMGKDYFVFTEGSIFLATADTDSDGNAVFVGTAYTIPLKDVCTLIPYEGCVFQSGKMYACVMMDRSTHLVVGNNRYFGVIGGDNTNRRAVCVADVLTACEVEPDDPVPEPEPKKAREPDTEYFTISVNGWLGSPLAKRIVKNGVVCYDTITCGIHNESRCSSIVPYYGVVATPYQRYKCTLYSGKVVSVEGCRNPFYVQECQDTEDEGFGLSVNVYHVKEIFKLVPISSDMDDALFTNREFAILCSKGMEWKTTDPNDRTVRHVWDYLEGTGEKSIPDDIVMRFSKFKDAKWRKPTRKALP